MYYQIQIRRGTASEWTAANSILAAGEIAFESDTNKMKVGNGSTAWNSLAYFPNIFQTQHLSFFARFYFVCNSFLTRIMHSKLK